MAGPTKRGGGHHILLDDGRWQHTYRQSTLGELDDCMEKGRLTINGELDRWETDAASMGTAMHEGIEANLGDMMLGDDMSLGITTEIAQQTFSEQMALPNFKWIQTDETKARVIVSRVVRTWYENMRPDLTPEALEIPFHGLVIYEDEHRVIRINGTMDYLDSVMGLGDWKTSNRKWDAWEKERWSIQATVYTLASRLLGIEHAQGDYVPFTYYVMLKDGKLPFQRIKVVRHAGDWRWLVDKCVAISKLIEADLDVWPKNDNHALCSPKWCPAWSSCKGSHYTEDWPRPTVPLDPTWVGAVPVTVG